MINRIYEKNTVARNKYKSAVKGNEVLEKNNIYNDDTCKTFIIGSVLVLCCYYVLFNYVL